MQELGVIQPHTSKVKLASVAALRTVVTSVDGYQDVALALQGLNTALHSSLGPILGDRDAGPSLGAGTKRTRDARGNASR